jgi:hypothetical protein
LRESYLLFWSLTIIEFNFNLPRLKGVSGSIEVTDLPIIIDSRLIHPSKAERSIEVTELPIIIDFKLIQSLKAYSSIIVTLLGIIIELKLSTLKKTASKFVTSSFKVYLITCSPVILNW